MSYPEELDTDDIEELVSYITEHYPTEEIRIHDPATIRFGYWATSTGIVSATLLEHIQAAGYQILHAGTATAPRLGLRRAWIECQKYMDEERKSTTVGGASNTDATQPDHTFTLDCETCDREYPPDEATIGMYAGDVRYVCPRCGNGTDGPSPLINGG